MTDLRDDAGEREERQRVWYIRGRHGRKNCKLRTDPQRANTDRNRDLQADEHRTGTVLVEDRQDAESEKHEGPSNVGLNPVSVDVLDG